MYLTGHTHEDVDQMFSVISRAMMKKKTPIYTPKEFETFLCDEAFTNSFPTKVKRVHQVLDATAYYEPHLSPHLFGLKHPSQVHWLQFRMSDDKTGPVLRYKKSALDDEWFPQHVFHKETNQWIHKEDHEGWKDVLISFPDLNTAPALLSSVDAWADGETNVREAIAGLTPERFPGWKTEFTQQWEELWAEIEHSTNKIEWNIKDMKERKQSDIIQQTSSTSATSQLESSGPSTTSGMDIEAELLVCGAEEAKAWRKHRKFAKGDKVLADTTLVAKVQVGDFVAVAPSEDSVAADAAAGYFLPISLGEVKEIRGTDLQVGWMFAEKFDGVWGKWLDDEEQITDVVPVGAVVCGDNGHVLKLGFKQDQKLRKPSLRALQAVVGTELFEEHCQKTVSN